MQQELNNTDLHKEILSRCATLEEFPPIKGLQHGHCLKQKRWGSTRIESEGFLINDANVSEAQNMSISTASLLPSELCTGRNESHLPTHSPVIASSTFRSSKRLENEDSSVNQTLSTTSPSSSIDNCTNHSRSIECRPHNYVLRHLKSPPSSRKHFSVSSDKSSRAMQIWTTTLSVIKECEVRMDSCENPVAFFGLVSSIERDAVENPERFISRHSATHPKDQVLLPNSTAYAHLGPEKHNQHSWICLPHSHPSPDRSTEHSPEENQCPIQPNDKGSYLLQQHVHRILGGCFATDAISVKPPAPQMA